MVTTAARYAGPEADIAAATQWHRGVGVWQTFSNLFSTFVGVGRNEKFRRNLQAPGKVVARLGSGIRKVVWDCTVCVELHNYTCASRVSLSVVGGGQASLIVCA